MRRILRTLPAVLLLCAGLVALAGVPSASAGGPIAGRLWDYSFDGPIAGMTVKLLTTEPDGSPGAEVSATVTGADGRFSLATDPVPSETEFWVRVEPGEYQPGWVGGGAVQLDRDFGDTYVPGTTLAKIGATPAYVSGRMVRAGTSNPVPGVVVTMRPATDRSTVHGRDRSGPAGRFRIDGLRGDDDSWGLKVNGAPVDYESGWRSCAATIVPTWGEACGAPLGEIGDIKIERR